jgi:uncharacterized protein with ATP-grasp and redox domains
MVNPSATQSSKPQLPLPPPLMMSEDGSFAHMTLLKRMPAMVKRVIAENDFSLEIVQNLETLLQDLPYGIVRQLKNDNGPDLTLWARYLEPFVGKRWIDIPWFFAEAYFFRRIVEATHYFLPGASQGIDPFALQKRLGLETAMDSIKAISVRVNTWIKAHLCGEGTKDPTDLIALLYFDLWGNRADLSLWPINNLSESHQNSRGFEDEKAHLLIDDTPMIATKVAHFDRVRIDFIVDNAGFELVGDLCLADFLLATNAAGVINLHLKSYPTFVSDATIQDVHSTLEVLAANSDPEVSSLANRWQDYINSGRLRLCENLFWTSPLAFREMPQPLQQELAQSSLVFVKGDANYRRCLSDRHWPFTTSFAEVVNYFPAPFAALRTLKSEIVAGLQESQIATLSHTDSQWLTNGQWGVIQFVEP